MTNVVQVYDYRFPNPEYEIMRFQVRISEGDKGPYVQVDAALLGELGVEFLIDEVLTGLGLSDQLVDWRATSEQQQYAIDSMKWAAAHKKEKE